MDGQYLLNAFVDEKDHAENVKKIEKMLKAHYEIMQSSLFKSAEITLQGVATVLLTRLS